MLFKLPEQAPGSKEWMVSGGELYIKQFRAIFLAWYLLSDAWQSFFKEIDIKTTCSWEESWSFQGAGNTSDGSIPHKLVDATLTP